MKLNKIKTIAVTAALAASFSIGGIVAYFADADTVTNTFTVGNVSLELQEINWDAEEAGDLRPNKTVTKDPKIYNDGKNEEFVFMEVVLPYKNVITANLDGTKNDAEDTELYSYTVNEGWTQVGTANKNTEDQTVTYLYVYGTDTACTPLAKDTATPTLFDEVTFANVVEDQGLENASLDIIVNAYGIQTTDINGGKTSPADVWSVLSAQAPSTDK